MPVGDEIRFRLGGDTTQLDRTFAGLPAKAGAAGDKASRAWNRAIEKLRAPGETGGDTRRRLADDAALERRQEAQVNLQQFRKKQTYEEANTVGRIKIVTAELAELASRRAKEEKDSTGYLKLQLAIEERLANLRKLQRQQASSNARSGGAGVQTDEAKPGFFANILNPSVIGRLIGSAVIGLLRGAQGYQQAGVTVASAQEAARASQLESLRGKLAAIGGLGGQVRQGEAASKDLQRDLEFYRDREKFLSEGFLAKGADFLTKMGLAPDELTKVQVKIQEITTQIQKQGDANDLARRELDKQLMIYDAEAEAIDAINRLRERGLATETKLARVEEGLANERLFAEELSGTPEGVRAAQLQHRRAQGNVDNARREAAQRLFDVNRQLSEDVAGGARTFRNGTPRPRSELERIAQRAESFRRRARDLIATGADGPDAARFVTQAMGDEGRVANRVAATSANIPTPFAADTSALRAELVNANKLLAAIEASLTIVNVGPIRGR